MPGKTLDFLKSHAAVNDGWLTVSLSVCREAARAGGVTPREAEAIAVENGICPARYRRNIGTLGMNGQAKLLRSRAAVVGCGGLGGWVIEMLARAGIGELALFDGDVFDEGNLNRQLLADERNLGMEKAAAAARRVEKINGAVAVTPHSLRLNADNAAELLRGCAVVIDALDNNSSRREVFLACRELGIPFVHGAVGGFFGQIGVFYPKDKPLWLEEDVPDKGCEIETGSPPFTPPFVAALQAAEAIKILAGLDGQLSDILLWFDIRRYDMQNIKFREAQ